MLPICGLPMTSFPCACESWTLAAVLGRRTQAFEMRCCRGLLGVSCGDHVAGGEVRREIQAAIGECGELLALIEGRGLGWFGRVSGSSGLAGTVLRGAVGGGRTMSGSGQGWALPARLGAGQDGKGLLQIHLWCPDDLPRLWDRIE